ncbi:MAG TPA: hypothetical protein DEA90_04475 [Opitutae bacterium]|nr:hypothetical protein [Puniceicoccaceae bacterium]HBR93402.1 hypothetical protein [Opitutae bacterium]|tara:strand:+ start:1492 stop:1869 length:378 start_codon:yes stop_codon:yes gene_type:complete
MSTSQSSNNLLPIAIAASSAALALVLVLLFSNKELKANNESLNQRYAELETRALSDKASLENSIRALKAEVEFNVNALTELYANQEALGAYLDGLSDAVLGESVVGGRTQEDLSSGKVRLPIEER